MVDVNFFIGTYSTGGPYVPNARGKGIHSCTLNLKTGNIGEKHLYQDNSNSTYLCKDQEDHLFAVCDNFHEYGAVKAFRIAKDSSLELLSVQNTYGTSSCHVEYEEDSKRIFIASYANAQLSIHGFDGKRFPGEPQVLKFQGNGPNSQRQESAHIHQAIVSPDKKWVYTCDLGSDKVWLLENAKEKVSVKTGMTIPAGSGPRHLVFHPDLPLVYVFCELDASLITCAAEAASGILKWISQTNTLPSDFKGDPAGAAVRIHPGGGALYVSNRNHDSISVYSIAKDGTLSFFSNFSVRGKEPRNFNIDPTGQWLLCANQATHTVITFALDPETGLPTGITGSEFNCGSPVCILF